MELAPWLVSLVNKKAEAVQAEREVPKADGDDGSTTVIAAQEEEKEEAPLAIAADESRGAPQSEEKKEKEEEEEEHAWFFDKEFFADGEKDGSTDQAGLKRKIANESEDEDEDFGQSEDEDDDEVQIIGEQRKKEPQTQAATSRGAAAEKKKKAAATTKSEVKGHYTCYVCDALVPKVAYSNRQRKKKTKRRMKCKRCMVDAVGKNVSTEPLTAAQLYMMNKDRFVGC